MITIENRPNYYSPVYNEHIFICSSTNVTQPNFKYLVDIYDTSGTLLVSLKQPPNPSNGFLVFDAHRIIESYVSYDFTPGQYGFLQNTNSYKGYYIKFGEDYLVSGTLTDYPSQVQSVTIYGINAALPWRDYANYNSHYTSPLVLSNTDGQFLTTPTAFNILLNQSFYLHFINAVNNNVTAMRIRTHDAYGTLIGTYVAANSYTNPATDANKFLRVSVGTQDVDNIPGITATVGALPVITANVASYDIVLQNSANAITSPLITFNISCECKYDTVRLHFLNKYGGFDAFNFTKINAETVTPTRQGYKRPYGTVTNISGTQTWGYNTYDRQNINFDTRYNSTYHLISDWLQDADIEWLRELVTSPVVFHEANPGTFYAVNVTDAPYKVNKKKFEKVYNLELDIAYAEDNYRQRS